MGRNGDDIFQIDSTHELYAHMNVNYVRVSDLPKYTDYGSLLQALSRGGNAIQTLNVYKTPYSAE